MAKGKRVRISNESVNCYGTRILTPGIDLAQYQRNPVLLYMHERGKVVGMVKDLKVEGQDVTGELVFDEATELSKQLKKQWEFGSVKMVSANFQILEMSDDKQLLAEGQQRPTVTKSKLIEVSVVDIGGNDDAIVLTHEGKTISLSAGQDSIDVVLPLLDNVSKTTLKKKEMELKELTNNQKRKEWLESYRDWPVWFTVKEAEETYYRYDLSDGYSVVVKEYKQWYDPESWYVQEESWYVQEIRNGAPVVINKSYFILTPDYHFLADCKSSETQIINHLRFMGKPNK